MIPENIFVRIDGATWTITVQCNRYRRAPRTIVFIEESPPITDFSARFAEIEKHFGVAQEDFETRLLHFTEMKQRQRNFEVRALKELFEGEATLKDFLPESEIKLWDFPQATGGG